jgi:hypothetical protein
MALYAENCANELRIRHDVYLRVLSKYLISIEFLNKFHMISPSSTLGWNFSSQLRQMKLSKESDEGVFISIRFCLILEYKETAH